MNQTDINDVLLAVEVFAAWILLIAVPVLLVVRHRQNRYIKSFCPDCDNPIEFPARGLGQSVECPHCQSQIVLRGISSKEKFFQRSYSQHFYWLKPGHIIAFVCVLLLCGTALFIYQDSKAQQLKREQAAAEAKEEARILADAPGLKFLNDLPRRVEQSRDPLGIESQNDSPVRNLRAGPISEANAFADFPVTRPPNIIEQIRQRSAQRTQEDIAAELHRANDIAEQQRQIMVDAEFNQRMQSGMQSFEQSEQNRKVINEIQEIGHDNRMKAINEEYHNRMQAINEQYQPQNQAWILRYNSFQNRWQYAPPNAQLKYNALANRWEFVPQ